MVDYKVWQGSCQGWVRKCVCAHEKSCCTGNIKGHMAWRLQGLQGQCQEWVRKCVYAHDKSMSGWGQQQDCYRIFRIHMSCRIPALKQLEEIPLFFQWMPKATNEWCFRYSFVAWWYKRGISLHIPLPMNIANARYHSLLGDGISEKPWVRG